MRSLFVVLVLCMAAAGCDATNLVNPDQPRDLGEPWINKTDTDIGMRVASTDSEMNRVFSCRKDELGSLLGDIAAEYETPIAVKPKKMLNDVAGKCHLTLGKSAKGQALLTFDRDSAGEEFVIDPNAEETED
jgi:hypothetical protein